MIGLGVHSRMWLLVGTITLATAQSAQSLLEAVAQARTQASPLALDVNWRPTFWDVVADPSAGPTQAALNKLAREEALWFSADDDLRAISSGLPQQPDVVVTDGAAPVRCGVLEAKTAASLPCPLHRLWTPRAQAMPSPPGSCTVGLLRWLNGCVLRPLVLLWFVLVRGIDPQPTESQVDGFFGGVS